MLTRAILYVFISRHHHHHHHHHSRPCSLTTTMDRTSTIITQTVSNRSQSTTTVTRHTTRRPIATPLSIAHPTADMSQHQSPPPSNRYSTLNEIVTPVPTPESTYIPLGLARMIELTKSQTNANNSNMWDMVVEFSRVGHRLAKNSQDELNRKTYSPTTTNHSTKYRKIDEQVAEKVRKVLQTRNSNRSTYQRSLRLEYKRKYSAWVNKLEQDEEKLTTKQREERRKFNKNLLLEIRSRSRGNSGAANRDADQVFDEIESAGGTAGGLDRWAKNIVKIPDRNVNELPSQDGGVLIEDPLREYYQSRMISPWSQAERLTFLEKFVAHGKDFRKIASFLPYQSVASCVKFYYTNKLLLDLKSLSKGIPTKRRTNCQELLVDLSKRVAYSGNMANNTSHSRKRRSISHLTTTENPTESTTQPPSTSRPSKRLRSAEH